MRTESNSQAKISEKQYKLLQVIFKAEIVKKFTKSMVERLMKVIECQSQY